MGPNFQTQVYEPLGEPHGDLWAQGATFGRDGPLRRQLLLPYHPCLAYLTSTCHSHWNARMGPKMGGQLDDPPDNQEGESRPQRTTFGSATPLTKPVKTRGAARAGGGGPARRGGSGGAGGGGPAQTAMCLTQPAGLRGPARRKKSDGSELQATEIQMARNSTPH